LVDVSQLASLPVDDVDIAFPLSNGWWEVVDGPTAWSHEKHKTILTVLSLTKPILGIYP